MDCPKCGANDARVQDCYECNGTGEPDLYWHGDNAEECPVCDGTGEAEGEYECFDCGHEFVEGD